jgi:hypothetical protein
MRQCKMLLTAAWFWATMLSGTVLHAQSPLSFYPHHLGDIWEYVGAPPDTHYSQNRIISDSLGSDGRYYIQTTLFGKMRIDTTTWEVHGRAWGGEEYSNLLYRLDATLGESWTVSRNQFSTTQAQVVAVFGYPYFGILTTVKKIDIVDSASQLLLLTDYLASGFGLVRQDIDAMPVMFIRGCILNGVRYGRVTSIEQGHSIVGIESFSLHQNYPNPFNPSTEIVYEVSKTGSVQLTVHDLQGREVENILNGHQTPGRHSATFEAKGLASGVYIYRLRTAEGSISRKMILLR